MIRLVLEISDTDYIELMSTLDDQSYFGELPLIKQILEKSTISKETVLDGKVMERWERT